MGTTDLESHNVLHYASKRTPCLHERDRARARPIEEAKAPTLPAGAAINPRCGQRMLSTTGSEGLRSMSSEKGEMQWGQVVQTMRVRRRGLHHDRELGRRTRSGRSATVPPRRVSA